MKEEERENHVSRDQTPQYIYRERERGIEERVKWRRENGIGRTG